jgi:hypothetical protein
MALQFPSPMMRPPVAAASHSSATKDGKHDESPCMTFEEACQKAVETQVPLMLTQDVILSETIRLRNQQVLHIQGPTAEDREERVKIKGDLHSLFLLNNKSRLILEHVDLDQTLQTDNHKEVGAAINLRSKGSVSITHSTLMSASGFCVWAVQKSRVTLEQCDLIATTRSAMVCFGQAEAQLHECQIDQAGVHAVCARGACRLELSSCRITNSAGRAIYAYANASVRVDHCHISGTLHPEKAAIELSSMGCGDETSSSLTIRDCEVVDNLGTGIRLRGAISYEIEGKNTLERNAGGDWDILEHLQDEDSDSIPKTKAGELPPLRRDSAGSSFRRGDWWCSSCHKINPARGSKNNDETCINCAVEKSKGGRLLTTDEIRQCNQGVDIRQTFLSTSRFDGDQTTTPSTICGITWQFDGDDEKGWLEYDHASSLLLEEAYQRMVHARATNSTNDADCIVALSGGTYRVNLGTMEQINTGTQFLRLVRRRTTK